MVKVYMIDPEKQREAYNPIKKTIAESASENFKHYVHVADIEAEKLDLVWALTQNLDMAWQARWTSTIHDERIEFSRSTMVGDIFEKDGVKHVVDRFGFTQLEK